ncbi:oxidoreductase [Paenibacillus pasadenensis]|uniref:oxidoreductase n=1 Tax=Paenibacillus pasadenensis TaxID=217090 RepID=UPI002040C0A5|nr:oxidoreductase [Paenibacillus pasadenensis]MCM3748857.1 oxidoreductase [Paenibacillus pasadenensis]
MSQKVALVTGASSGIGKEAAIELKKKGFKVYAAARRIDKMQDLAAKGILPIALDVTDDESMIHAVNLILQNDRRIDVLINNAGYGSYGAIEDVPLDEARRQMDVNVFGLARMIQLVTPSMRKNRSGKIINVSSMGGKIWTKFGGWYHATKFAVEGLSDCLRLELEPFGIDVIVVEPGGIKTDWGIIAAENLRKVSAKGPYAQAAGKAADSMVKQYTGNQLSKPALIGQTIAKAVTVKKPKTRYLVGFMAKPMVFIKNVFGDRAFDRLIKNFS